MDAYERPHYSNRILELQINFSPITTRPPLRAIRTAARRIHMVPARRLSAESLQSLPTRHKVQ